MLFGECLPIDISQFDGAVENSISSSFTAEQWEEWLDKNVA